jgi:pimeloyl-ACP methyl ester carboxylesterase
VPPGLRLVTLRRFATNVVVDGDGPTVVFVPGATLPLFVWDGLADAVASAGFRTVRYDLVGRGGSGPAREYTAATYQAQLLDVLDRHCDGPVHVVSLAFGCLIAADLPAQRVRSHTFIAPDGFGVRLPRGSGLLRTRGVGELVTTIAGTKILLRRLPDYSAEPAVVARVRAGFEPYAGSPELHRATLAAIRSMPIHEHTDAYRAITCPRLVIWGDEDRIAPPPAPDRLAAAFPGAEVELLPGVGHLPHFEVPHQTALAVVDFLRGA